MRERKLKTKKNDHTKKTGGKKAVAWSKSSPQLRMEHMFPLGISRCVHISKLSKLAFVKSMTPREIVR